MTTLLRQGRASARCRAIRNLGGFTLIELLVATACFLVISAAAFSLFNQQQVSASTLKGRVGLNLALRNAATQLQMDLVNAGSGYFQGLNIPTWPVGVTIVNRVVASGSSCYDSTAFAYGPSCFDQITIIATADPATYPPVHATDNTGGSSATANCSNTSSGTAYAQTASGRTLAQTAALFHVGDPLLLLNSNGSKITSVVLTNPGQVSGSAVQLTFNPTNANGSNSLSNDPLDITACDGQQPCTAGNKLGAQFCGGDWILKLAPITYSVDSSNPANPTLLRSQGGSSAVVMDQIIGFKVGAAIWNDSTSTMVAPYNYDASTYSNQAANDQAYNFTLVRSVRVSLIGRTAPNGVPGNPYRNAFDQGPYMVQGTAVVVNPRNMSMND